MVSVMKMPLNEIKQTQSLNDVNFNNYYKDLRKPIRRIKFFKNGDRYYTGKMVMLTPNRYASFRDLMRDLSKSVDLPYGVRKIYTPRHGHELHELDELVDGNSYVCGSFEPFKAAKYGEWTDKPWNAAIPVNANKHDDLHNNLSLLPSIAGYNSNQANVNIAQGYFIPKNIVRGLPAINGVNQVKRATPGPYTMSSTNKQGLNTSEQWSKPRLITIVKTGERPRKKISILLNRKAIHNFEQFICDISDAFGLPQWKNDKIRKLYTIRGRRVQGISDFFRDEEVFIGVSGKQAISITMIKDLIDELYPNNPNAQNISKEWEKTRKLPVSDSKNTYRDSGYADDDTSLDNQNESKDLNESKDYTARDSKLSNAERIRKSKKENETTSDIENHKTRDRQRGNDELRGKREVLHAISEKNVQKHSPSNMNTPVINNNGGSTLNDSTDRDDMLVKKIRRRHKPKKPVVFHYDLDNHNLTPTPNQHVTKEDDNRAPLGPLVLPKLIETQKPKEIKPISLPDVGSKKLKRQITNIRRLEERYDISKVLGDGNFAIVKQCKNKENGHEYALKIIDKSKMKGKEHMIDNEIKIMKACNHTNIVKLYEDFESINEIYLITELIKGGDLFDAITQSVKFNEKDASGMVKDLCEALFYLHSKNVVHRDLKPENLLVMRRKDGSISIKLADFGLAMEVKDAIFTVCGTPTYVAPEILAETGYGLEVDMWACGVITYILLCGFPPFRSLDRNQEELFQYIQAGEFEYLMPYWEGISDSSRNLIDHLLVVDIKKRWKAEDVLSHPWVLNRGNSKQLPDDVDEYCKDVMRDLKVKKKQLAAEPLLNPNQKKEN